MILYLLALPLNLIFLFTLLKMRMEEKVKVRMGLTYLGIILLMMFHSAINVDPALGLKWSVVIGACFGLILAPLMCLGSLLLSFLIIKFKA